MNDNQWVKKNMVSTICGCHNALSVWTRFMGSMNNLGILDSYRLEINWHVKVRKGYKSIYLYVDGYEWRL